MKNKLVSLNLRFQGGARRSGPLTLVDRLVRSWCRLDSYAETEVREGRITCKHSTQEDLGGPLKFFLGDWDLTILLTTSPHALRRSRWYDSFISFQNDLRRLKLPQPSSAVFKTSVAYRGFSVYKSLSTSWAEKLVT